MNKQVIREEWLMAVLDVLDELDKQAESQAEHKVIYEMACTLESTIEITEEGAAKDE
jgi:hypothetical protein